MSAKSELASCGMALAQIGQTIAHAVVDNGGTDEDTKKILGDKTLAKQIAELVLGKLETVIPKLLLWLGTAGINPITEKFIA